MAADVILSKPITEQRIGDEHVIFFSSSSQGIIKEIKVLIHGFI